MSNYWKKIIETVFGKGTELIFPRFFYSKKNQVTLLNMRKGEEEISAVAKFFVWGDAAKEWDILVRAYAYELNVPKPIKFQDNIIFMDFIPGNTFQMMVESKADYIPVEVLALWLSNFHRVFKRGEITLIKGDGMLPNFIFHRDRNEVYGIDFEEAREGREIEDIVDIITTILMAGDSFSDKNLHLARKFADAYLKNHPIKLTYDEVMEGVMQDLNRRISFMPHREKDILGYMELIKEKGKDFLRDCLK